MNRPNVLIIGGGISGLSTAWWLARCGIGVEIWEAGERPGGKIRTTREQGYLTERAAGLLVNHRPEIDRLVLESGLEAGKSVQPDNLNRYVLRQGQLVRVPMEAPALMTSNLWSWQTKVRLMSEMLIPRGGHESETVAEFITRRFGREVLETTIEPFIAGTLASDVDQASAQAVLPRLTELERRFGSITMGMLVRRFIRRHRVNCAETFSFRNGMSELVDTLGTAPGVKLRSGLKVVSISREGSSWRVVADSTEGRHIMCTPQLVLSIPADNASEVLRETSGELASLVGGIDYAPLAVLHLGFQRNQIRQQLDGTGFLVPRQEGIGFNGNIWMSGLFPERAPEGHALLSTYLGGTRHPGQLDQDDMTMMENVLSGLSPLMGIRGLPDYVRIDRHPKGLPLYHGDYPARIEQIRHCLEKLPGLHINANYIDGVSVRERIFQSMRTANKVSKQIDGRENAQRRRVSAGHPVVPSSQATGI